MTKLYLLLLALIALVPVMQAQEADDLKAVGVSEVYLARDDGSGKAGAPATGFLTTDVPIHCVVQLNSTSPVTVRMKLVAVNVAGVKPQTSVVTTSYKTKGNESRVNFSGRPEGRWVPGKYRADIYIGSIPAASRMFTVERAPEPPKTAAEGIARPVQDRPPRKG